MAVKLRQLWATEGVRFLIVGGFNTLFGLLVFYALDYLIGTHLGYLTVLVLTYVVILIPSYVLHRTLVFKSSGHVVHEFFKFCTVYIVPFLANFIALPILVSIVGLDPSVAQTIIVIFSTAVSYIGHRYFSFSNRRRKSTRES